MHQQLTIEFDANQRRSVAHVRRSLANPNGTVGANLPQPPVRQIPTRAGGANFRHGHAKNGKKSREYRAWRDMRARCTNPALKCFHNYGGRGIEVCERWGVFVVFFADMGPCPDGYSLDRIDVNGNYEPANCRWADQATQSGNRRNTNWITAFGETKQAKAWATDPRCAASYQVLIRRVRAGASPEEAMATPGLEWKPPRRDPQMAAMAKDLRALGKTYRQISDQLGIPRSAAYHYVLRELPTPTQYLRDLERVDPDDCFFSSMGRLANERGG